MLLLPLAPWLPSCNGNEGKDASSRIVCISPTRSSSHIANCTPALRPARSCERRAFADRSTHALYIMSECWPPRPPRDKMTNGSTPWATEFGPRGPGPVFGPESAPRPVKMTSRRPKRPPRRPKRAPRGPQRGLQDGLRALQEGEEWLQDCQRGPEDAPRGPQEDPHEANIAPFLAEHVHF